MFGQAADRSLPPPLLQSMKSVGAVDSSIGGLYLPIGQIDPLLDTTANTYVTGSTSDAGLAGDGENASSTFVAHLLTPCFWQAHIRLTSAGLDRSLVPRNGRLVLRCEGFVMDFERDGVLGGQFAPLDPTKMEHRRLVVAKLKSFKENHEVTITYKQIAGALWRTYDDEQGTPQDEPITYAWLRKFMSNSTTVKPSGLQLNLIYRYLDSNGGWDRRTASRNQVADVADSLYFSLLNFFDVPELTTTNLLRRLPGIYRIYRPLLTHPDHFVIGVVLVDSDKERGVLSYKEYNAVQPLNGREGKHVTLLGYAFKKSNFVTFFSSDSSKSSIHITTFTSCEIQEDRFIVLLGGFFDTLGKKMYSGQVIMERINAVEASEASFHKLSEESCCLHREQLPPSIATFFNGASRTGDIIMY